MLNNERLMPREYAAKMRAARRDRAMRGERRIITILFCDVVGSTEMAGQLDPEEWAEIMNEAFEYLITPIYRYEGTVARLMGDAILAFFGAPIAHEDDPTRAILAAMEIVDGIQEFAEEIREDYGLDFNVRVGMNTGPVVVGEVGNDLALEYTAMGDAINLASRMESTAEPGHVQITEHSYQLIAPLFDVRDMGPISVKGKDEPVQAYCVVGLKERPERMRGIRGLHSPLVGRDPDLDILKKMVANLQEGKGGIVVLTGDAGLGKSRLIDELQAYFAAEILGERIGWVEGRGISYDSARPYGVIMQMFRQMSGVSFNDTSQVAREKIRAQIQSFRSGPREPMTRALDVLLAIEDGSTEVGLQGEELQRELFAAFEASWRETTARIPLVAVNEDIQWADPASIDLLLHLFQQVGTSSSLFICTYRRRQGSPALRIEEMAVQSHSEQYTPLDLQPLNALDGANLVQNLLGTAELPQKLCDRILDRADGNPFFIEEVVRGLMDSGALVPSEDGLQWDNEADLDRIKIPNNVHSLLVSRIDRLEPDNKRVVQLAAVIGRSYYRNVLARIVDPMLDLDEHLDKLLALDLIEGESGSEKDSYVFRQAMTRDAAYQSLLHRQRRRTHRRVAEVMEELFDQRLEEEAHQIAYHFLEARRFEKALHYYTLAGDRAARLYANEEAVERYGRALEIAINNGTIDQLVTLFMARGRVYELGGRYEEALSGYKLLQKLGIDRENQRMQLEGLLAETTLLSTYTDQYDPQQGRALLQDALKLAEALDDRRAQAKIYWNLMLQGTFGIDKPEVIVGYGEKAVALAREGDYREILAYALNDLARPYTQTGQIDKGLEVLLEAGDLWRELGNLPMLADNRATLASGLRWQGKLIEALALAQEALAINERIGNEWGISYSANVMGPIYLDLGRIDEALTTWGISLPAARKANFVGAAAFVGIDMSLAYGYIGETEKGLSIVREAGENVRYLANSQLAFLPLLAEARLLLYAGDNTLALKLLSEPMEYEEFVRTNIISANLLSIVETAVELSLGNYETALKRVDEAIAYMGKMGLLIMLLELWLLKGETLIAMDRHDEASAILDHARHIAQKTNARKYLWLILRALTQATPDPQQSAALHTEMETEITYIATQIADEKMRSTLLNNAIIF